ncbi:glycoside hydrolase family 3 protein [Sphingomonas sp. MMS24-J13]|uniref:glycoside hydrolase family 3 protein n=1 Tax=Sphingomonas sp. MMS24-J13 TaxID=3238686 RepID=UPI00384F34E9
MRTSLVLSLAVLSGAVANAAPAPWRDLNHNGRLDPYEDSRLGVDRRVADLLRRMTLAEKVGAMMHGTLPAKGADSGRSSEGYDLVASERLIETNKINSFITRLTARPREFAAANNAIQRLAEKTRLGIPVTISTDPRNHFQEVLGASTASAGFSLWPETLGLAAIGDPKVTREFAAIARAEYRAVGIHVALSPQVDLASEPRWPRVTATFGADPAKVSAMAGAYVRGFQGGDRLVRDGVATVAKHWVGYGAEPQGFDGHNVYGRFARLTDKSFAEHVAAFSGALAAHTAGIMPTYVILQGVTLDGKPLEPVAAGFSRQLLTDLLRGRMRFDGMVVSDWAITNDCAGPCVAPTAKAPQTVATMGMPWGVETLSKPERFAKGVAAGIDQFGGVDDPTPLMEAVRAGKVSVARIDQSVRRILRQKFVQGLFDDPYVDPARAAIVVGSPQAQAKADAAQRAAQVVLENKGAILPLAGAGKRVWLHGVDPATARAYGFTVVDDPAEAQLAIVRAATPSDKLHPYHFFGSRQNEGRLDFRDGDADYEAIKRAAAVVPTIVAVNMDRPAILTNVQPRAAALLVTFGASDRALLDVLSGRAVPRGRLPFELPSSMAAVEAQDPAVPDDSAAPLYRRGAGLDLQPR